MSTRALLGRIEIESETENDTLLGAGNSSQWLFDTDNVAGTEDYRFRLVDYRTCKPITDLNNIVNVQISKRFGCGEGVHVTWSGPDAYGWFTLHVHVPEGQSANVRVSVGTYHSAQR